MNNIMVISKEQKDMIIIKYGCLYWEIIWNQSKVFG